MLYKKEITKSDMSKPLLLSNPDFWNNKYAYYKWLRENDPIHKGKIMGMVKAYFPSHYEDCLAILKDPRFVRNRTTATGGGRLPFPLPKSVTLLMNSMINVDQPDHRRLRTLVHRGFTPRHIANLQGRIESLSHELLDKAEKRGGMELKEEFARPIPVTIIAEMLGIELKEMPQFLDMINTITTGFQGLGVIRTLIWDLPKATKFVRKLIERKRSKPADDILTALIDAEEEGEKLSEDELVAMVFLLIIAGYETTYNLITNAVYTLFNYPEQLEQLRAAPDDLLDSTIEEVLRFNGPIQATKLEYATEDIQIRDTLIPKGATVLPLLGSANHDPAFFDHPEVFDITRKPNKHLGFGVGVHYCLGAPLARLETKIALKILLERSPNLRLAKALKEIKIKGKLGWHEYADLPVLLG